VRKIYLQKEVIGVSLNLFLWGLEGYCSSREKNPPPISPMPKQTDLSVFF
jgi:hypothetical protein